MEEFDFPNEHASGARPEPEEDDGYGYSREDVPKVLHLLVEEMKSEGYESVGTPKLAKKMGVNATELKHPGSEFLPPHKVFVVVTYAKMRFMFSKLGTKVLGVTFAAPFNEFEKKCLQIDVAHIRHAVAIERQEPFVSAINAAMAHLRRESPDTANHLATGVDGSGVAPSSKGTSMKKTLSMMFFAAAVGFGVWSTNYDGGNRNFVLGLAGLSAFVAIATAFDW